MYLLTVHKMVSKLVTVMFRLGNQGAEVTVVETDIVNNKKY